MHNTVSCLILFGAFIVPVDNRQMCWSCQFVHNGRGIECATAPANWTEGEARIRCPDKCIITAEFDAQSGDPTFLFRGCGTTDYKDNCEDNGVKHVCSYSCEGQNYCNDKGLASSPLLDDSDCASGLDIGFKLGCIVLAIFLAHWFTFWTI